MFPSAQPLGRLPGYKQTMSRHARALCAALFVRLIAVAQQSPISIRVVEGDGAINSIRLHRAHDPVIQVLDHTGEPLAGATVTFLLPASGPSGTFQDNGLSQTMQTGRDGRAAARGLRPNAVAGQFRIRVTASWQGQAASAALTQTNAEPVAKSKSSKTIVILAIVGAAAAGGIAAAAGGHGAASTAASASATGASAGGTTGSTSPGAVIVPGTPGFGPPH